MLADRSIPDNLLDIISYYAVNDPDPKSDIWKKDEGGFYGGPYEHGINCVRGQAAEAIAALLCDDSSRIERLRSAISALSVDPVISVRTCAIKVFLQLLNFSRDEAVALFKSLVRRAVQKHGVRKLSRLVVNYPMARVASTRRTVSSERDAKSGRS